MKLGNVCLVFNRKGIGIMFPSEKRSLEAIESRLLGSVNLWRTGYMTETTFIINGVTYDFSQRGLFDLNDSSGLIVNITDPSGTDPKSILDLVQAGQHKYSPVSLGQFAAISRNIISRLWKVRLLRTDISTVYRDISTTQLIRDRVSAHLNLDDYEGPETAPIIGNAATAPDIRHTDLNVKLRECLDVLLAMLFNIDVNDKDKILSVKARIQADISDNEGRAINRELYCQRLPYDVTIYVDATLKAVTFIPEKGALHSPLQIFLGELAADAISPVSFLMSN